MELEELAIYAKDTWQLAEPGVWHDQPGVSVIRARSGKWLAVLMKEYNENTGEVIERCDIKCGPAGYEDLLHSFVTMPFLMKGSNWIGLVIDDDTDYETVCRLFDRAVEEEKKQGYTFVLDGNTNKGQTNLYRSTPLPSSPYPVRQQTRKAPEKILQMQAMYKEYPGEPLYVSKARNFYYQAKFMEDYEDGQYKEWKGQYIQYFCTYHDLNTSQLISYFSWRTQVRRKNYRSACLSFVFLYIYELLNGIGVKDPYDGYKKLCSIDEHYFQTVYYQSNTIDRWRREYLIYHGIANEEYTNDESEYTRKVNHSLLVVSKPEEFTDEEVYYAIRTLSYRNALQSVLYKAKQDYMQKMTANVYRHIFSDKAQNQFKNAVQIKDIQPWAPFDNAVFYEVEKCPDVDYVYNEVETYHCRDGKWTKEEIVMNGIREVLAMLIHETDRVVREYLGGFHKLKKKKEEAWITPYVEKVLEEEKRQERERNMTKVNLDSAFLNKIRDDAAVTRDALLTEEEMEEVTEPVETKQNEVREQEDGNLFILRTLLAGEDVSQYIHEHHLMPAVVTDEINEAFFDEIGDSILECDGETITLVEDYRSEVEEILGGKL